MGEKEVEEFVALCASVLDDGEINEERAYQLGDWLNHHEAAVDHWPFNKLTEPLQAVWAEDGTANPEKLQALARVLVTIQEEWSLRKGAMAAYYKSLGPATALPALPTATKPLPPPPKPRSQQKPPQQSSRRSWIPAAAFVAVLLVAAGLFAARKIDFDHFKPAAVSSSPPTVQPSAARPPAATLAPARTAAAHVPAKAPTPALSGWTVTTTRNVKASGGRKDVTIAKGTTVKVVGRTDRDLMISYKGEDLTIPASATTSLR